MTVRKKSKRLDEDAWVHAALILLAKSNIESVSIDVLARNFGITKGSFYHHFENRDALLAKMLSVWMNKTTFGIISRINAMSRDPKERLKQLMELPSQTDPKTLGWETELAIRSWARRDELAYQTIVDVDKVRVDYTRRLFLDMGLSEEEAATRANIVLAFILGESMLSDSIHNAQVRNASVDKMVISLTS